MEYKYEILYADDLKYLEETSEDRFPIKNWTQMEEQRRLIEKCWEGRVHQRYEKSKHYWRLERAYKDFEAYQHFAYLKAVRRYMTLLL